MRETMQKRVSVRGGRWILTRIEGTTHGLRGFGNMPIIRPNFTTLTVKKGLNSKSDSHSPGLE